MFYLYEGGGNKPKLLGVLDTDIDSTESCLVLSAVAKHKVNSISTLDIAIPADHSLNSLITDTTDIVFFDTYGEPQEYHITEIEDVHDDSLDRYLYCEHSAIELNDSIITETMSNASSGDPADYLAFILSFTRWQVGTVDKGVYNSKWNGINDLVGKNCMVALGEFISKYNCEVSYRFTIKDNVITGRYVDIKKQVGNDYGKRFSYEKDINSLKRTVDASGVKTAIFPRIAVNNSSEESGESSTSYTTIAGVSWSTANGNPVNKPLGDVILVNSDISYKYQRLDKATGKLIHRVMYAEWTQDTATDANDLINQAWLILKANSTPKINYECNASDLYLLSGKNADIAHEHVKLGDRAVIIDKAFKPELRVKSRIMEMTEDLLDPTANNFVFGNTKATLSTSSVDQQQSLEEQLHQLENKLPEYTLPFQNGKPYYDAIKEEVKNEFVTSSGYVMIENDNGLWVFDRPADLQPTKAVIVKGGNIGLAKWNTQTSSWELGTFINGTSVNADFINTGHLSGDVIEGHSITADHLTVEAIAFIKTGLASEDDLNKAVEDITQVKNDITGINKEITTINKTIDEAIKGTLDASKLNIINNNLLLLDAEYNNLIARANSVYNNQYLVGQNKVDLDTARTAYKTAYTEYTTYVNTIIADKLVTDEEYTEYVQKTTTYNTALVAINTAIEDANTDIINNVYAQARQGLVTTAELEVNNKSVIASAKLGMVSTGDMTEAIQMATKDLVATGELQEIIDKATSDLTTTDEVTAEITKAKVTAIQETFKPITTEYKGNLQQANTIYANTNLTGTAKTNLNTAKTDYTSKYNALATAIKNIVDNNSISETYMTAYNTALANLQTATTTLGQRLQEAIASINTAVYNNAKKYADGLKTATDKSISDVNTAVGTLREDVNTTIKDGIVSEAEALAIKSNIQVLNSEKADIDKEFTTIYANGNLTGTAKTDLNSKKTAYNTAHTNLVNSINNATADGKVTTTEKSDIDSKFNAYSTALANYKGALQTAIDNIASNKSNNVYTNAKKYADGLKTTIDASIKDVADSVGGLREEVTTSFKDGIISKAEAITLQKQIDLLNKEKNGIDTEFTTVYENSDLTGTPKTNLNAKKTAYNTAHTNLISAINTAIKDSNITSDENSNVNAKFTAYCSALCEVKCALQTAIDAIADAKSNGAYTNAKKYADGLKTTTDKSISDVNNAVGTLRKDVTTTIKDGIVSNAEALSIKSNIDVLNMEKADVDKEYTTLYANSNLTGTPKTELSSKKTAYNTAHTNLVNSINNAIKDNVVTTAEKTDINSKMTAYSTALGNYRVAVQNAIDAIASNKANNAVNNINYNVRNLLKGTSANYREHNTYQWYHNIVEAPEDYTIISKYGLKTGDTICFSLDMHGGEYGGLARITTYTDTTGAGKKAYAGNKINAGVEGRSTVIITLNSDVNYIGLSIQNGNIAHINNKLKYKCATLTRSNKDAGWTPAPEDTTSAINDAVKDLASLNDVTTAGNNAVIKSNIETIKQTFKTITAEYNNNLQQANTTYNNSYLSDTAKTNLNTAKSDYTTKYNAVKSAHDSIVNANTLTTAQLNNWNTAITNLQTATTTLALRLSEAINYINTAVYNASKKYTDETIPDKLTGYAKTSYVDSAKAQAIKDAKAGMVSTSDLQVNNSEILMTTSKMGQYNMLKNTDYRNGTDHWSKYSVPSGVNWDIVTDTDVCVIAGEKAFRVGFTSSTANKAVNYGMSQTVALKAGVSYTLSYWINTYNSNARVDIFNPPFSSEIASKTYGATNGNNKRETHKYDSITFTPTVSGSYHIVFTVTKNINASWAGIFITKPMLCTGINAQAWTGHPDEIYVGVVSITEEHGIKVEHSDANTYSSLDATGLKIWEYNNDNPVASFGDGNTAYISTVNTKKLIADNVTPTITVDGNYSYYFSNTGSGDYSGKDDSNCCAGFTGAMARMCDDFGIDRTHTKGNFFMQGNGTLNFFCHGSVHDEDFYLENIYGGVAVTIGFVKELTVSGSFSLINIQCPFRLFGNRGSNNVNEGCIFKRGAMDGVYAKHCSRIEIAGFRFTSNQNTSNSGIAVVDGTNAYIKNCDIDKFNWGIYVARQSTAYIVDNRGTSGFCGCYAPDTATIIYRGSIPAGHSNHDVPHNIYLAYDSVRLADNPAGASPQYSLQSTLPVTSQTITNSFSPTAYRCVANYTIDGEIRQGSWNGATSDWTGYIYFGSAPQSFLSGGSNSSAQIYLQRRGTAHGYYSAVPVIIAGTNVGSLSIGEGKWFSLPSSALSAIASGNPVTLTGKGNSQYIKFESNSSVRITTTKRV